MKRSENVVVEKTEHFADRIIKMCRYLNKRGSAEKDMLRQIYRSGTSIGANIREAQCAESNKDFVHKLHIALKETNETQYWFEVMFRANILTEKEYESLNNDLTELYAILTSIIKTSKQKDQL